MNVEPITIFSRRGAIELFGVVRNDFLGHPVAGDTISPKKFANLLVGD